MQNNEKSIERKEISNLIVKRIKKIGTNFLKQKYLNAGKINFVQIDELLPEKLANDLSKNFTKESDMVHLKGPQENKYVGVNFKDSEKIVEECLYAFQEDKVIKIFAEITSIKDLSGDKELYAGGISSMSDNCFLNPHIDNSHDRLMQKYRRCNLLYYVNNKWDANVDGGELVLYPEGLKETPTIIPPKFNSLIIMRTDNKSIHGVNPVLTKFHRRKCISNYYFSKTSPLGTNYYHSTSFSGFKGQLIKGIYLEMSGKIKSFIKKSIFKLSKKSISTGLHKGGKKSK